MDPGEALKSANLAIIRRHDNYCHDLIYTSPICDIYEYNPLNESWEQIDCKGSLFLYSRTSNDDYPYAIMVLNRQGTNDFTLGLTPAFRSYRMGQPAMEVDLQDATIMVQLGPNKVIGLWLFDEADREKVASLMRWCIKNGSFA